MIGKLMALALIAGLHTRGGNERQTQSVSRYPKGKRIDRNSPCRCGSGKKYKKCHGATDRLTRGVE